MSVCLATAIIVYLNIFYSTTSFTLDQYFYLKFRPQFSGFRKAQQHMFLLSPHGDNEVIFLYQFSF
jgi:hypothetical protein